MTTPKYYKSRLVITGSDSVDEFVKRHPGASAAEARIHAMIENWLEFDDIHQQNLQVQLAKAEEAHTRAGKLLRSAIARSANAQNEVLSRDKLYDIAGANVDAIREEIKHGYAPPQRRYGQ